MNELLQQRIESVQAGRNTTHAQLEAKRSLREKLDSDLEAFLKNGGAVEQLPQGFSGECSKGRGGELCKRIGVAHGFISQITNQVRPCSKDRYEQIKLAMKAIEQLEQAA